ncbi:Guanylate kinase [hydrothermal vent metagenome]|uniref:Guanylate kinase n=1 Tax=hydrothermal vent metagenome TaxID=652676 RepID=A0A3B0V9X2_9ZZZZ
MIGKLVGTLFIVSAPSGTGKTSLVNALVRDTNHLKLSISSTTRKPRPREIDGYHYHFIEESKFQQKITAGDFLEYAKVFGNLYGTALESVDKMLHEGHDVVLEIDWQGAQLIKSKRTNAISIFILPPSINALRERLESRGQDSKAVIDARMKKSIHEISHFAEADYLVINDDFEDALKCLKTIVRAHRLETAKQVVINEHIIKKLISLIPT